MPWTRKLTFAAPLIRTAITTLQTDIADAIAAFNAEGNAQIVAPADYIFGAADPLILINGPVVEVSIPTGQTGNWAVGLAEFDHDLRLNVCAWSEGDRGELPSTYEQSLGLARCIIEVLSQDGALGAQVDISNEDGIVWRTDVIPEDPTGDGREFRKWRVPTLIQFRLETVDRFQA